MRLSLSIDVRAAALLTLGVLLLASTAAAEEQPSESNGFDDELQFAQDAFVFGDYQVVVDRLEPILLPSPPPLAAELLVEGYSLLGVSAFFIDRLDTADAAFLQLLLIEPSFRLDPLLYPAQVISRFQRVRNENAELLVIDDDEPPSETVLYIESRYREQSILVSVMPFGYGFFAMDRDVLGLAYLLTGVALGLTSASLFVINESQRDDNGFYSDLDRAERRQRVQIGTGIAFWGVIAANMVHGALLHPREAQVEYRTLSAPPEGRNQNSDRAPRR